MHPKHTTLHTHIPILLLLLILLVHPFLSYSDSLCRNQCGTIPINYPFGVDDGCGAPQFRTMFTCNTSTQSLFFTTPNGNYKVQSIDYKSQTLTVYDPDMSTCTILQPHHDIRLTDIQYAIIPPSPDTVFALLNCSVDSPVLHRYRSLCFDVAGHKCEELYSGCNSFRVFTTPNLLTPAINSNNTGPNGYFYAGGSGGSNNNNNNNDYGYNSNNNNVSGGLGGSGVSGGGLGGSGEGGGSIAAPPCCFTGYSTVKVMSMDILDCTHFTSFYDSDKVRGVSPMDWSYGLKFSYSVPDMGCQRCAKSGGTCGFDGETEALMCLCDAAVNSTRQCGVGTDMDTAERRIPLTIIQALIITIMYLILV